MDIHALAVQVADHENYRVLVRLPEIKQYLAPGDDSELFTAAIVDVETTGFDYQDDRIFELGAVKFTFDKEGHIYDVIDDFHAYEDPGRPIPPEITMLTGTDDAMVSGAKIDDTEWNAFMEGVQLVVAHNAGFDRKFMDLRFPEQRSLNWGCSLHGIDWAAKGIGSAKLDYLAYRHGFFHEGHRAVDDCRATLHILAQENTSPEHSLNLSELLEDARRPVWRVWAQGAPIESKDIMKARGYRWNAQPKAGEFKAWFTQVRSADLDAELGWLADAVYFKESIDLPVQMLTARNRYAPAELLELKTERRVGTPDMAAPVESLEQPTQAHGADDAQENGPEKDQPITASSRMKEIGEALGIGAPG